jgi:hypothetical protein
MVCKLATGKMRNYSILTTIRRPDGTITSGLAETVNAMMDHFTPADHEITDSECHKLIKTQIKTQVTTEDDKLFTTAEV